MNFQKESANRRIARSGLLDANNTARVFLGPFAPGEYIQSVRLFFGGQVDTVTAGRINVQIALFSAEPRSSSDNTADNFAANGRPLTGPLGNTVNDGMPLHAEAVVLVANTNINYRGEVELPVAAVMSGEERFIGVSLGSPSTGNPGFDFSVWAVPGHTDQFDSEE